MKNQLKLQADDGTVFYAELKPISFAVKDEVFLVECTISAEIDAILNKASADKTMKGQMESGREMTTLMFRKDVLTIQKAYRLKNPTEQNEELFSSDWDSEFWRAQDIEGIAEALGDFRKRVGLQA